MASASYRPRRVQNLIAGAWQPARCGRTLARENPADTSQLVATCPASETADVADAMAAARQAAPQWAGTPVEQRATILARALDLLEAQAEELAAWDVRESGKTLRDCQGEIARAIAATRYQLKISPELLSSRRRLDSGLEVAIEHAPVGVAALITPWNYPFSAVLRKSVPALVAGNAAVVKPSELTPVTAELVGAALREAGLPAGVYNLVFGAGDPAGQALVDHPDIGAVSFTGSTRVGLATLAQAGARDLKIQVEMGGKNPLVVLADADLETALDAAVTASYTAAGQWCIATSRIILQDEIYEQFRDRFVERTTQIRVGDGFDPLIDMGPVSSRAQYGKVLSYLSPGTQSGKVLCGGGPAARDGRAEGYFIAPTVIDQPAPDSAIVQEEIFGPVASLLRVPDLDHAIEAANATPYGLCAAIFTRSEADAVRFARAVDVGRVGVNLPTSVGDMTVPGGGRKNSGRGEYEGAEAGITFFTHLKPVFFRR